MCLLNGFARMGGAMVKLNAVGGVLLTKYYFCNNVSGTVEL